MRLSKAQVRVIRIMYEHGCSAHVHRGTGLFGLHAFFGNGIPPFANVPIRARTVEALYKKGLVENITAPEWRWRGSQYILTEKGMDKEVSRRAPIKVEDPPDADPS